MDKETVEIFLGKFVQLVKRTSDNKTFKLYGEIQKVTSDSIIIYTDRLGAVLLEDIVSIREAEKKQ